MNGDDRGTEAAASGDTDLTRIGLGTNRLSNTLANVSFVREAVAAGGTSSTPPTRTQADRARRRSAPRFRRSRSLRRRQHRVAGRRQRPPLRFFRPRSRRACAEDRPRASLSISSTESTRDAPLEQSLAVFSECRDDGKICHVGSGGRDRPDRACPAGGAHRRSPEPLQPFGAQVRSSRRLLPSEGMLFSSFFFPLRGEWGSPRSPDRLPTRGRCPPRSRSLAPSALPRDAADPRHSSRAPAREPGHWRSS